MPRRCRPTIPTASSPRTTTATQPELSTPKHTARARRQNGLRASPFLAGENASKQARTTRPDARAREQRDRCANASTHTNERNANAAIVCGITPEDYAPYGEGPLAGIELQRHWEARAFELVNDERELRNAGLQDEQVL